MHAPFGRRLLRRLLLAGAAILLTAGLASATPARAATIENEKFVNSVYRDLLLRPAKLTEIAYWAHLLDKGVPREQLIGQVQRLPEHRYQQVRRQFNALFGRHPNRDEMQYFAGELIEGSTVEHMLAEMLSLDEFYFGRGGGTNDGFVDAVFLVGTGALPSADDHATFVALANKVSRETVARTILNTEDTYTYLVKTAHKKFCREPIDKDELGLYVSMLMSDMRLETVLSKMMASDEYFQYAIHR